MTVAWIWLRKLRPAFLPACLIVITALVLGAVAWRNSNPPLGFVGGWEILLIVCGIGGIVSGATSSRLRTSLGALSSAGIGLAIVLACAGIGGGVGFAECFKLWTILVTWTALGVAMGRVGTSLGAGISVGMSIALSTLLCASPVIMMPAVRALAGTLWQPRLVQAIAGTCPLLAVIHAVRPGIRVDWAVLPGMYEMSGLGQEVPMTLAPWWINAAIYSSGAAALILVSGQTSMFGKQRDNA